MDYVAGRELEKSEDRCVRIRTLVMDGVIEVYLNDVLFIQCAVPYHEPIRPGLYCENGTASFKNIEIFELED